MNSRPRLPSFLSRRLRLLPITGSLAVACLLVPGFALRPAAATAPAAAKPVKVFVLAGQSNMVGQGSIRLMEYQLEASKTDGLFDHWREGDDQWATRNDVWVKFRDRAGKLTVGGYAGNGRIGPELEFGRVLGDHYEQPVLLIKTAWGGKSLFVDFRPPSAGLPPAEVLAGLLHGLQRRNPDATPEDAKALCGHYYREMIAEVEHTLANLGELFPEYEGQGYELEGFVWFQGWNDMINTDYTDAYAENMARFIRDVRKDLKAPRLPFVIGQLGVDGVKNDLNPKTVAFKEAQARAAALPEFKGNVAIVPTDVFWDTEAEAVFAKGWRENLEEWKTVGDDYGYHYLGSVKTFCKIGKAFAEAMLAMQPAN